MSDPALASCHDIAETPWAYLVDHLCDVSWVTEFRAPSPNPQILILLSSEPGFGSMRSMDSIHEIYEYPWMPMMFMDSKASMDIHGFHGVHGYPWIPWISIDIHGYLWNPCIPWFHGFHGYPWISINPWILWMSMESMDIHGIH